MVQTQQVAGESALLERLRSAASEAIADVVPTIAPDPYSEAAAAVP